MPDDEFDWGATVDPGHAADALGNLLKILAGGGGDDPLSSPRQSTPQTPEMAAQSEPVPDLNTTGFLQPFTGSFSISSPFGQRGDHFHAGTDIGMPTGTPLLAATAGTVTHAASDDPGGYGTWVEITRPDGVTTRYGHLSSLKVRAGQSVGAGTVIGLSGATGNSRGAHLHFEIRRGGTAIDPAPYLSGASTLGEAGAEPASSGEPVLTATPEEIAGNKVNSAAKLLAGEPVATDTQGTTTQPVGAVASAAPQGMDGYYVNVLKGIGAPATPANLAFMRAWQRAEGGDTTNPFNTTQDAPGATVFNSVGVKRYPSQQVGVGATVKTLTNGRYAAIIAALKQGKDPKAAARALAGSPWGTGELVMKILGG